MLIFCFPPPWLSKNIVISVTPHLNKKASAYLYQWLRILLEHVFYFAHLKYFKVIWQIYIFIHFKILNIFNNI